MTQRNPNGSVMTQIVLDRPTKAMLKELASAAEMSMSEYVRELIENAWNVHQALEQKEGGDEIL